MHNMCLFYWCTESKETGNKKAWILQPQHSECYTVIYRLLENRYESVNKKNVFLNKYYFNISGKMLTSTNFSEQPS